ncbi:hypothetical protein [Paucihalobacter ruber]|nr:hypothetical protein [Paucihalobacter ruber]
MKIANNMTYQFPKHLSDLPIYNKAIEIFILSRSISSYLNQDLCGLHPDGSEDPNIYFSGDIVQQSESLAPEILKAEQARFSDHKYRHIHTLNSLTRKLYNNCKRLENSNSDGRDFLKLLRKEIGHFKQLQRTWMLSL